MQIQTLTEIEDLMIMHERDHRVFNIFGVLRAVALILMAPIIWNYVLGSTSPKYSFDPPPYQTIYLASGAVGTLCFFFLWWLSHKSIKKGQERAIRRSPPTWIKKALEEAHSTTDTQHHTNGLKKLAGRDPTAPLVRSAVFTVVFAIVLEIYFHQVTWIEATGAAFMPYWLYFNFQTYHWIFHQGSWRDYRNKLRDRSVEIKRFENFSYQKRMEQEELERKQAELERIATEQQTQLLQIRQQIIHRTTERVRDEFRRVIDQDLE